MLESIGKSLEPYTQDIPGRVRGYESDKGDGEGHSEVST